MLLGQHLSLSATARLPAANGITLRIALPEDVSRPIQERITLWEPLGPEWAEGSRDSATCCANKGHPAKDLPEFQQEKKKSPWAKRLLCVSVPATSLTDSLAQGAVRQVDLDGNTSPEPWLRPRE